MRRSTASGKRARLGAGAILAAFVVVALAVGCTRKDERAGGGTASSGTSEPTSAAAGGRWAALLSAVPAERDLATGLVLNDIAAARRLVAASPPALDDRSGWLRYVDAFTRGTAGVIGNEWDGVLCTRCQRGGDSIGAWWQRVFGYTVADVDLEVSGGAPPRQYAMLQGRFDPSRIEAAFKATPEGGDGYRAEPRDGGVLLTTDCEDGRRCHLPTDRDAIGRDLRAYVSPGLVIISPSTQTIDALLATRAGSGRRLVDEPAVAAVVDAVDRQGLYTASVAGEPPAPDPQRPAPGAGPYAATAVGLRAEDDRQSLVLVFAYGTDEAAASGADALRAVTEQWTAPVDDRPWSSVFGPGEITTDGAVVVGSFPLADPAKPEVVRNLLNTRGLPPPAADAPAGGTTTVPR